jgi:hypothetical protein
MCMSLSAKRERVRSLSNASQCQLVSVNVSSKLSVSWAKLVTHVNVTASTEKLVSWKNYLLT